jgi:hypothetical protein
MGCQNQKAIKAKINNRDHVKQKSFYTTKAKTEWEKMFANYIFDEMLITEIYKDIKRTQ